MSGHKSTSAQAQDHKTGSVSRRTFLRAGAGAAGAVAVGAPALQSDRLSPVGRSEAIGPWAAAAIGAGAVLAADYLIGEAGDGDPADADDIIQSQLVNSIDSTLMTRMDGIKAKMGGVLNEFEYAESVATEEGMMAARNAWAQQKSKSEVKSDAHAAAAEYLSGVMRDIVEGPMGYTQTVEQMQIWQQELADESSVSETDHIHYSYNQGTVNVDWGSTTVTLPNGDTLSTEFPKHDTYSSVGLDRYNAQESGPPGAGWTLSGTGDADAMPLGGHDSLGGAQPAYYYLAWQKGQTAHSNVKSSLTNWIDNLHDSIANGELSIADTFSAGDFQRQLEKDNLDSTAASLISLGYPVSELDGSTTITTSRGGIDWTLKGLLAVNGGPGSLNVGQTYNAESDTDGTYMMADWNNSYGTLPTSEYEQSIDGGLLRMTSKPYAEDRTGLVYNIKTVAGEQATVPAAQSAWTETTIDGSTRWEADISGQLNKQIVDVEEITVFVAEDAIQDRTATVKISGDFTVKSSKDGDGNDQSSVDLSPAVDRWKPADYQTAEDFQEAADRRRSNFEDIRNAIPDDDGPLALPGLGDVGSSVKQWVLILVAGIVGIFALNAASG